MNSHFVRTGMLVGLLLVALASVASAGIINCVSTPSDSACAPTLSVTYTPSGGGATTVTLGGSPVYSGGGWQASFTPQSFPAFLFTGGQAATEPDPFVGFSFGVINTTTGNLTFSYDFITPFGGGSYQNAQTIFVDVLLDTAFAGTASVTPTGDPFIMESYVNGVLISGFGRGTGCTTAPSPLFFCQSGAIGSIGPVPYLSAASGNLEVKGSFILTPNSQYTLSGRTELLDPVPEPGSLMLLGSGILGLAGVVRRRLRA
jgi:PEP-CTERM motif